jgi:glycosyltransferase involved in cell wall biosynthesis
VTGVDAVVQVGDLGSTRVPFYLYQDLSYAIHGAAAASPGGTGAPQLGPRVQARREQRQQRLYDLASGVLVMGRWFADELVRSGMSADKIHVVGAGWNVGVPARLRRPDPDRLRLLFLGRDFVRKAGDDVVEAVLWLRANGAHHTLTVAGPAEWPYEGPVPAGLTFVGPASRADVATLIDSHDVLLMPSRFEAFGIAIVEALVAGMPVVARRAYAMPDLVPEGCGVLVEEAEAGQIASAIRIISGDPEAWQRCFVTAPSVKHQRSWDAVASAVTYAIEATT